MNNQRQNNPLEEGYIKFKCHWMEAQAAIPAELFLKVNTARRMMVDQGLIGCYENGVGFGNISIRDEMEPEKFYITGSATGYIADATEREYTHVVGWDIDANTLWCNGPVKASSESMSHAVIYEILPLVQCVIHIHNMAMWQKAIGILPCTPEDLTYGTPEMARAIEALIREQGLPGKGILAMKGHEEGIIAFGNTVGEALQMLHF